MYRDGIQYYQRPLALGPKHVHLVECGKGDQQVMEKAQGFIRRTKQREVILRVLRGTKSHPTADWVYQEVRRELPNISLGTVYRNLKILTASGEALELSYGSSYSRFDGTAVNHYHFVCRNCGRVDDVPLPVDESVNRRLEQMMGVKVLEHRLEFYGLCHACHEEMRERTVQNGREERPEAVRFPASPEAYPTH